MLSPRPRENRVHQDSGLHMLRVISLFSSIPRYFGLEPIEMIASKTD